LKRFELLCWGLALVFGLIAGYVNLHAKEVQPPALVVLLSAFLLGYIHPKRAWLWALIMGLSISLSYAVASAIGYQTPYPPTPNAFASLIALIPAFVGAYVGVLVRSVTVGIRKQ